MMQQPYDVVVIGGGAVGSAIARELSRYRLRIAVVERAHSAGGQAGGRATGLLHAGVLYRPGTLKAVCAVEGSQEFDAVAAELDVPFRRTGGLIVGFTDGDRKRLEQLLAQGRAHGVRGLELIGRRRMDALEPCAGGSFALWCPASGVLDPRAYTAALAENAVRHGVEYFLGCSFTGETRLPGGGHVLHTTWGDLRTRWVVNSAGLNSAAVSGQLGIPGYAIQPVEDEYIALEQPAGRAVRMPVCPVPGPDGPCPPCAAPTADGGLLLGPVSRPAPPPGSAPSAQDILGGLAAWRVSHLLPQLDRAQPLRSFAGVQPHRVDPATGAAGDFVLELRDEAPGVVNLVGIGPPGLTSALPLARRAVSLIQFQEPLSPNPDFDPRRRGARRFSGAGGRTAAPGLKRGGSPA